MNYDEALDFIHGTYKFGSKLGLKNITELLLRLGNPQEKYKCIHVAGTNGKGSTSSMISTILHEAGYKVGMFISPYLENFTERIQVGLKEIPKSDLAQLTQKVRDKVLEMVSQGFNHPTEFEIVTAMGFLYFAREEVDIAVIEVGLGGRFDSTNVIVEPLVSVITSIGFDHMKILGNTLAEIAFEKAGIIKENRPVVSYPQLGEASHVIREVANKKASPIYEVHGCQINVIESSPFENVFDFRFEDKLIEGLKLKLIGEHQILNAATAITAIEVIKEFGILVDDKAIRDGISKVKWPGRLEKVMERPTVILDGAHNSGGADVLAHTLSSYYKNSKIVLVIGILKDKEVDAIINRVCPLADTIIVTRPDNPRALDPADLLKKVLKYNQNATEEADINKAIQKGIVLAGEEGTVIICGSLYLVGSARAFIKKIRSNQ